MKITVYKYLVTICLSIISVVCVGSESRSERPNVLVIISDDLMKQIELYGDSAIKTPALSELANESMLFDRAYAQYPLCGPSRASLFISKYPSNSGITWNQGGKSESVQKRAKKMGVETMPAYFRKNGYVTIGGGKLYHDTVIAGSDGAKHDFSVVLDGKGKDGKKVATPGSKKKQTNIVEASEYSDYQHKDGALVKNAKKWLNQYADKKAQQPFFMALGLKKPHSPFSAPKRFFDMYDRDAMQLTDIKPPNDIITHYSLSKPTALLKVHADTNQYTSYTLPESKKKEIMHGYSACVSYIDFLVGDLIKTLKQQGLYDNTIILFTSDHGYKLGEYDRWAKYTLMEKDSVVPLLVRVPSLKETHGTRTNAIVGLIDLYPTLAELSSLPTPKKIDGVSFVPTLKDRKVSTRDYIHTIVTRSNIEMADGKKAPKATGSSVITKEGYRYTQWWQGEADDMPAADEVVGAELYDHYKNNNTVISEKNIANEQQQLTEQIRKATMKL
ncbi:sulfatase [Thalassotalea sp. PLHSN55]|uniref:sulfatase n=1 Tax=Thalassotalea sp. PLHSN55 TaxID=3435888 RepID=UPI003F851DF9